jgi:ABC-type siderophore export system fused ATPase/permease subunit
MTSDFVKYSAILKSILIVFTYILTFSSLAYLSILIVIILLLLNYGIVRYVVFVVPLSLIFFIFIYKNVPEFKERLDGVIKSKERVIERLKSLVDLAVEVFGEIRPKKVNKSLEYETLNKHYNKNK